MDEKKIIGRHKELANFLKNCRKRILPSQVGLAQTSRRRTPGLRREEVAYLAGIGVTWYTWLEQGRSIQVSDQVLESLSRVLLLTEEEKHYLYLLANQPIPVKHTKNLEAMSQSLQEVLNQFLYAPAFIIDNKWHVIAWNSAATRIFGDFEEKTYEQRNLLWVMFTNEDYKKLFNDWASKAKGLLSRVRVDWAYTMDDPDFQRLIDRLKNESEAFNTWWSSYDIQPPKDVYEALSHPELGDLTFNMSKFDVTEYAGFKLIVHTPTPGTNTYEKIKSVMDQ